MKKHSHHISIFTLPPRTSNSQGRTASPHSKVFVLLLLFSFANFAFAQNDSIPIPTKKTTPTLQLDSSNNTITTDTISKKKKKNFIKRYFQEGYPSPRKAAILSLILPGTGQIYNKKGVWVKLPIVYAGLATGIYFIDRNTKEYKYFRDQYKYIVDGDDTTVSDFQSFIDLGSLEASTIKNERIKFNKWRQATYAGFVVGYLLIASEAYVTAHLLSFDVSDDLSLRVDPKIQLTTDNQLITGIGFKLNFRNKQDKIPKFRFSSP